MKDFTNHEVIIKNPVVCAIYFASMKFSTLFFHFVNIQLF